MASAARDLRYRNIGYTDGSLAHDLDWAVRERELNHAGELPKRKETVRETPKVKARPEVHVQIREKQQVSLFSLVGFTAVLGMAILVLMSYIQLTVLSAETVTLKNQLSALETENIRLTAQYEQMFDLSSVQEAALAAGMVKPGNSQVCYIDLSEGDSAVVYQKEDPSTLTRVLTSVRGGASAIVEYLN